MYKKWLLGLFIFSLFIIGFRIALPYGVVAMAQYHFPELSQGYQLSIKELNLSLLNGRAQMQKVEWHHDETGNKQSLGLVEIDIRMLALFDQRIVIEDLVIEQLDFAVHLDEHYIHMAGIAIPINQEQSSEPSTEPSEALPLEIQNIRVNDVHIHYLDQPKGQAINEQAELVIETLKLNGNSTNGLEVSMKGNVKEASLQKHGLALQRPLDLFIEGQVLDWQQQPSWQGNVNIEHLNLNAPVINNIRFSSLQLNEINLDSSKQVIANIILNNLAVNEDLLQLEQYQAQQIQMQNQALTVAQQGFSNLQSRIQLSERHTLENIEYTKTTEASSSPNDKSIDETSQDIKNQDASNDHGFTYDLKNIEMQSPSRIRIQNAHLPEPFDVSFTLKQLQLKQLNQALNNVELALAGNFDEYDQVTVNINGDVHQQNLKIDLTIKQFNLVALNGYIEQSIGYSVNQGLLDVNIQLMIKAGQLQGEAKLKLLNSDLEPSDQDLIDKVSKQISMPVSTALALLKDDNNNIQLTIPISGDINAPDFGTGDLTKILTKKALKSATSHYLAKAFFPYGLVYSAAEYLGEELFAMRLDSIVLEDQKLNETQILYLKKISEILRNKPELQLRVCPLQSEVNKAADWKQQSEKQADLVKQHIVSYDATLAERITLCKARLAKHSEIMLGIN